jgi:hypothetical protein
MSRFVHCGSLWVTARVGAPRLKEQPDRDGRRGCSVTDAGADRGGSQLVHSGSGPSFAASLRTERAA